MGLEKCSLSILVVEHDHLNREALRRHLSDAGHRVTAVDSGRQAIAALRAAEARLVIVDLLMPGLDGLELCRQIRAHSEHLGFIYILLLTGVTNKRLLVEAFDAGANDFLVAPYDLSELLARVTAGSRMLRLEAELAHRIAEANRLNAELALANEKLGQLATTDELTGLFNRRQALAELEHHWTAAARYEQALACAIVDVDHFKNFNDTHGHDAGDLVLKSVAGALSGTIRAADRVCRYGGEEFLILCPGQFLPEAMRAAERWRAVVESTPLIYGQQRLGVTISIGVAIRRPAMSSPADLLRAADAALYAAKRQGRNRVVGDTAVASPRAAG